MGAGIFSNDGISGEIHICGQHFKILGIGRIDYQHDVRRIDSISGMSTHVNTGLVDVTFRGVQMQPAFALSDAEWAKVTAVAQAAGTGAGKARPTPLRKPHPSGPAEVNEAARVFLEGEALREQVRWEENREYYA